MAEIQLPELIKRLLEGPPTRLPFEDSIDGALDKLADGVARNRVTKVLEQLHSKLPSLPGQKIATPLGFFELPPVALPKPTPPQMDERKKDCIKAGIASDLASLVEKIPVLGAIAGPLVDSIDDTAVYKLNDTLNPKEWEDFKKYDKISPLTTIAVIQTFLR